MKISYNWLKELVDFDCSPHELAEVLTMTGSEVEGIEVKGAMPDNIVVGKVLKVEKHPDADRLTICSVDIGSEQLKAVCGAPNVRENQTVIFAKLGAVLDGGIKLRPAKIRGVESFGMIVAEDELGISEDHTGIIVLDDEYKPGTPIDKLLTLKDYIFELEITPNRPDCLSHIGIAREIKAKLGGKISYPDLALEENGPDVAKDLEIIIENPDGCPRYTGRLVSNVTIGQSPLWLKARLNHLGIRPISNVVDITNYVLLETGQPLHAFDFANIKTKKIVVRSAKDGDKFTTLDGQERTLNSGHLLITDGEKGVALAGIMGGLNSEVTDTTKTILMESAYFDAVTTRRGAKAIGLSTEASQRFERGADPEMAPKANDRACQLIAKLAGGVIHKGIVDTHPKPFTPVAIDFRPERANHVLGSDIKIENMLNIFDGLDISYKKAKNITVYQPSFRPDLVREIDLIEEVARIWGLDNIEDIYRPGGALTAKISPEHAFRDQLRQLLIGHGFYETFSLTLTDKRQLEKIDLNRPMMSLMNPLSEEMSVLRPDLIISVMKTLRHNINYGNKDIKIFEIGTAYKPTSDELPEESQYICIGLSGREQPVSWHQTEKYIDFYSLKAELEAIFGYFKIGKFGIQPQVNPYFDNESTYLIKPANSKESLGICGKINKDIGKLIGLKQDCYIAQLDMAKLTELGLAPRSFQPLPKYPSTDRDIALVVDNTIPAGGLIEAIYKTAGKLAVEVFPFDLYKGKNIGEGKKSIAIRIIYRSEERTLTDDETDKIHQKVIKSVTDKFKAELRT